VLHKLSDLHGFTVSATTDEIGSIDDFYFDDRTWDIRYVIVDTGPWIFGRRVLLVPSAIQSINWTDRVLSIQLTKEQIENSPPIDAEKPVSRQNEIDLHEHYGWSGYWYSAPGLVTPAGPLGSAYGVPIPPVDEAIANSPIESESEFESGDPYLRSAKEVQGYNIQATDDDIGHVEDFFADEEELNIRYMLVDTRNWLPGRNVLVGTKWINRIDWTKRDLIVDITREQVENSPEYNPVETLSRGYEENLHKYYHLPPYWY